MCLIFVCRVAENVFVVGVIPRIGLPNFIYCYSTWPQDSACSVCAGVLFLVETGSLCVLNPLCERYLVIRGFFRNVSVCLSDCLIYTDLVLPLTNKTLFLVSFCSGLPCLYGLYAYHILLDFRTL